MLNRHGLFRHQDSFILGFIIGYTTGAGLAYIENKFENPLTESKITSQLFILIHCFLLCMNQENNALSRTAGYSLGMILSLCNYAQIPEYKTQSAKFYNK